MASVLAHLKTLQEAGKEKKDGGEGGGEIPAEKLSPCYFLHGDEPYLGRLFVDRLKELLFESGSADFNVDRFWMDESGWADVIDAARTAPTFFSPWRLVTAAFPLRSEDRFKDREEDMLTDVEAEILDAFLRTPRSLPGTILVVLYPSRNRKYKSSEVYKMFSKHFVRDDKKDGETGRKTKHPHTVTEIEISCLKTFALQAWLGGELAERKLVLTAEARARLVEVVGNDLGRLAREMDKLQAYAADRIAARSAVDVEEIDRVCAWTSEVAPWDLTDALSVADWPGCARVLDRLFDEGEEGIKILNDIGVFFRKVRQAKTELEEGGADRKTLFSKYNPKISEKYSALYARKFREFFLPVVRLSRARFRSLFLELNRLDAALKSGAGAPREMIEAFVFDYCRKAKEAGVRRTARG